MGFARTVAGIVAGMLVALVVLDRPPADAGPTVFWSSLICADPNFGGDPVQTEGRGTAHLKLVSIGNTDLQVEFKAFDLPPSAPVVCGIFCETAAAVRGLATSFVFNSYVPSVFPTCGSTNADGKFSFFGTVPFVGSVPFDGGCLLPIPAFATLAHDDIDIVCAPGFGILPPPIPPEGGR